MPTIDNLDIRISAEAKRAEKAIDSLSVRLGVLSTRLGKVGGGGLQQLSSGVLNLSNAMKSMQGIGTKRFEKLAENINKLGNIDVARLNASANALSSVANAINTMPAMTENVTKVAELAKSIAKLGGKNVSVAIANIPALENAMASLITTLSKSPKVSQNVIDLTNAVANLAKQGTKAGTASKALQKSLVKTSATAQTASKKMKSFAYYVGKLYANYFLLIRGIKGVWSAIESAMDYREVINYFDAAFGQVAEQADLSSYEKLGYESAEAYYNSFAERAKEITAKMTGYNIGANGEMTSTGTTSLGINPSSLMNYQAMFGQMASSMGVTSENALILSEVLTKIGADLASVKNMDFSETWTDMASGLAGMSRTLDKYGANIRNVNLQERLLELGINANIASLGQNDKALLRTIVLLDSTRYAWADLADTINQPSNQLRLLKSNFDNLATTVGNIFLPAVTNILPYINGLVIAFQRLAQWVVATLDLEMPEITSTPNNEAMSDMLDQIDEAETGLDGATSAAKKFKQQLQGFDELNVLTTQDDTDLSKGTGLTDGLLDEAFLEAVEEYNKVWEKAYDKLENQAGKIADKIEIILEPFKSFMENIFSGDFGGAGKDLSDMASGLLSSVKTALDKVDWDEVGKDVAEFLKGIDWGGLLIDVAEIIVKALSSAFDAWKGAFDATPIETIIVSALALLKFTGVGKTIIERITGSMAAGKLAKTASLSVWSSKASLLIAGSLVTAFAGYNLGVMIWEAMSGEKMEMTFDEQMSTIFNSLRDGSWKDALTLWGNDIRSAITGIIEDIAQVELPKITYTDDGHGTYSVVPGGQTLPQTDYKGIAGIVSNSDTFDALAQNFGNAMNGISLSATNMVDDVNGQFRNVDAITPSLDVNPALSSVTTFVNTLNNKLGSIKTTQISLETTGTNISDMLLRNKPQAIALGNIRAFATGGFPEDGLFWANHTELVGQFSNGRTAVANNEMIVAGIEGGVERAVSRTLAPYLSDIAKNTRETADKPVLTKRQIYDANIEGVQSFKSRTGKLPF